MLRFAVLLLVVLTLLLCATARSQDISIPSKEKICQTPARLIYVGDDRLYLWVDAPFAVNSDFRVQYRNSRGDTVECPIATCVGQMAVSERIEKDQASRPDKGDSSMIVFLDTTRAVSGIVRVGQLEAFNSDGSDARNQRYSFSRAPLAANMLPIVAEQRYYSKVRDAEIDLALGKIDMLILPKNEAPEDASCKYRIIPTGAHVEWYLIANLPDNDLSPCALNYCLKYEFGCDSVQLPSLLLDTAQINRGFSRDTEKARALFAQIKPGHDARWCLPDAAMFPQTASRISKRVQECGGRIDCRSERLPSNVGITLRWSLQPDADSIGLALADEHMILMQDGYKLLSTAAGYPDSCKNQSWAACEKPFGEWISRECRFVPLGRIEMIALVRQDMQQIADRAGHFSATYFYRSK